MDKGRVGSSTNDDALEKAGDLSVNGMNNFLLLSLFVLKFACVVPKALKACIKSSWMQV